MTSKMIGIYCIRNKINGKRYIGRSLKILHRWKMHRKELNSNTHKNNYLQKAWNKYGEENFEFEILELCEEDRLDELEIHYIKKFDTFDNKEKGYNLQSGGNFPKASESTRKKISESNKGRKLTEEQIEKIINTRKITKTSTGIYRVVWTKDETCLQGYRWVYGYQDNGKRIEISRTNLLELKRAVESRGLEWIINDEHNALKTILSDLRKPKLKKTLSEEHKKKLSEYATKSQLGTKNHKSIYTLWDSSKCYFSKRDLVRSKNHVKNLLKVFMCKYKGYRVPIGYFHDFLSCEIISDIIEMEDKNEYFSKRGLGSDLE